MNEHLLTVRQYIDGASRQLGAVTDTPRLEAKILYKHASKLSDVDLITSGSEVALLNHVIVFQKLLQKRIGGRPIAYITGEKEFWSMKLMVNSHTLIPRPETELLVELALKKIELDTPSKILDLGTGSGAIALAIASERPDALICAIDQSSAALQVAVQNATAHGLDNIRFKHSNWFDSLDRECFDLIVANPPYIDSADPHLNQGDLRFEPKTALVSDHNGLADIVHIIHRAPVFLKPRAWLIIEHGFDQKQSIHRLFSHSIWSKIECINDLSNQPRITFAQYGSVA